MCTRMLAHVRLRIHKAGLKKARTTKAGLKKARTTWCSVYSRTHVFAGIINTAGSHFHTQTQRPNIYQIPDTEIQMPT